MTSGNRRAELLRAAGKGAAAGLAGGAAMIVTEKAEQLVTRRPDSYVPARALLTVLGRSPDDGDKPMVWNHLMHFGTAASLGALRGVWAATGIRGVSASAWHTAVRLSVDQTVENATGVGAPPAAWPRGELAVDVGHKAVFAAVTGALADRAIRPTLTSYRGLRSH
ncbi:hypothetical protein ACIQCV_13960 [Dietzia maris]|uniref:Uncharacterized protein n=1 Tax=Dietzia maris TaxID=37915 RepID=A0A365PE76_9ACTN|nr:MULTISPECIES: hypothetical protein [Dietzia]HBD22177.1 hypothetical protein [Dietzia sp.]MBB0996612.1 hypothetical protein [Dietzia maris]MCZ4541037.1 hypothetical protein [Dietzia maris]MCZ4657007.1 hypothetical protein [Dietzia kunjamensis]MDJ0421667.1 hypothetical protein [Dietzia kunjamensis]